MKFSKVFLAIVVFTFPSGAMAQTDFSTSRVVDWQQTSESEVDVILSITTETNGGVFLSTYDHGVFRSTNNGSTWMQVNNGLTGGIVTTLVTALDGSILAGTTLSGSYGDWNVVYRSINNGDNWTPLAPLIENVHMLALNSQTHIFIGTDRGIYRSTDDGLNWTHVESTGTSQSVRSLNVAKNGNIWAGTAIQPSGGGLLLSTDNGNSRTRSDSGIMNYDIFSLLTNENGDVFVGTASGLYRSLDRGINWSRVDTAFSDTVFRSLVLKSNEYIFAGTERGGIFRSSNNGTTWEQVNSGLTNFGVRSLAIDSNGNVLSGTYNGLHISTDNGKHWNQIIITSEIDTTIYSYPISFGLSQNYPNPFNPVTTIQFSLPHSSFVTLKVFNLLGKEVSTIVSEQLPPGTYSRQWDASKFASGVYYYRLHANDYTETKRLVLIK